AGRHLCRGASDREARLGAPSADAYYGENDRPLGITQGVLTQALTVDFTRSFHDTVQCATFTELTAASHAHPYVIHTRMEATEEGQVTTMESVVTDADDWVFGADAGGELGRDSRGPARPARGPPGGGRRLHQQLGGPGPAGAARYAVCPARGPYLHRQQGPGGPDLHDG